VHLVLLIPLLSGCGLLLDADPRALDVGSGDGGGFDSSATDSSLPDSRAMDTSTSDTSAPDTSTSDTSRPDTSISDASPDVPPSMCTGLCGDANQDGVLSVTDLVNAGAFQSGDAMPNACQLMAADVVMTGAITHADLSLISMLIVGRVTGGCEPCARTCGDVNGDGMRDITDQTLTSRIASLEEVVDFCTFWAADTDADRDIDSMDAAAISGFLFSGDPEPTCADR